MFRAPLVLLSVLLIGSVNAQITASPTTVDAIQADISVKQKEYDNYSVKLQGQLDNVERLKQQLIDLRAESKRLESQKSVALEEMNAQFQRMIDDPSLDISASKQAYANSVSAHKKNKEAIQSQLALIDEKEKETAQTRVSKHILLNTLESLKEELHKSRVERLHSQFNQDGTIRVQQSVDCELDSVISECIRRTEQLAKQKASKRFLDKLFGGLSESELASSKRGTTDASVKILSSNIDNNGFSGVAKYSVTMDVALKGNLTRKQACQLLGLDSRYCIEYKKLEPEVNKEPVSTFDPSLMYELTIRSNVFDDEVFIDGVSYGSTKLNVMLPAGKHDIEVVKLGHQPYITTVQLTENLLVKANLIKDDQSFVKGEQIHDILRNGQEGPTLVAIPAGGFLMGDISGKGQENERPVVSRKVDVSFGIGEREVTVKQFSQFVDATNYVTEAERGEGCAFYDDSKPTFNMEMNWRNPGYEQSEDHPVVCVTLEDARAYTKWLSENTKEKYRLPTEVEWEYAARAGTETDFWWGESIGSDNANCGWCGTPWSNNSAAPVASFKRNNYGLYDVIGNVWEWSDNGDDASVVRGGAWNFAPSLARVSTRLEIAPNFRSNYIGFRVARDR